MSQKEQKKTTKLPAKKLTAEKVSSVVKNKPNLDPKAKLNSQVKIAPKQQEFSAPMLTRAEVRANIHQERKTKRMLEKAFRK